jgi:hypothetical protein
MNYLLTVVIDVPMIFMTDYRSYFRVLTLRPNQVQCHISCGSCVRSLCGQTSRSVLTASGQRSSLQDNACKSINTVNLNVLETFINLPNPNKISFANAQ